MLIPKFDDRPSDAVARSLARELYPDREVVQLSMNNVGNGGGGIHCVTQQQPAA